MDDDRMVGAVTLERAAPPFSEAELALLADVSRLAAPVLELKRQLALPWHARMLRGARDALASPSRRTIA
ncbi:GAF domain-containing protein [Ramlibacter terrae]|uniref:GAF domain-containing protein n=1 Tax=Ramlibacter terrae TaxID=2732511 RepID=A0ABX6P3R6_9BURK|nr:GAF domain-containing protein [Ramlibacter terrae]